MKYLLDTCVLLWALSNDKKKLTSFNDILLNHRNFIAVSVVTYWEIVIKKSLGKLDAPDNIVSVVEESGFAWINLETKHIAQLAHLPLTHSNPFDRLLIAQAKEDGFNLLTADPQVLQYFKTFG